MAHFAKVTNGLVTVVHLVANPVIAGSDGNESELLGQQFLSGLWGGDPAEYVQCSYNSTIRGCYPGVGYSWDGTNFAPPVSTEPDAVAP